MQTTRETGKLGEDIACTWLEKHGFFVIERNYLKKWGEIDIIATKDKLVHFVEVKSELKAANSLNGYRPEDNVHELKIRRLRRTIETYLLEKRYGNDTPFKFHVLTVSINTSTRRARVNFLENIVL
jgi:putative endonuclease